MANLKLVTTTVFVVLSTSAWAGFLDAEHEHIVSMPMHQYKQDCGTKSQLRLIPGAASLLQQNNVPGAGVDKFAPFETVLKDGFLEVDCVKDYMYYRGDKFGDNKHDYKLGPVSNVSIVHYEAFVAKRDRVKMTQKVCFEFCRTVPNMGFFGIVNGRGCYCTPYFTPMESDSSQCDANCVGDNTLMCGGKSKSSIFAMHMCESTGDDLSARSDTASDLKSSLNSKANGVHKLSSAMQHMGVKLQKDFGAVGDSGAAGLMQDAKVFAGTLEHKVEAAHEAAGKLGGLSQDARALKDFSDPAVVTKAERIMEGIDEAVAAGEAILDELDGPAYFALPGFHKNKKGAAKQYYPVMYFVDKKFEGVPSTCSGDKVGEPLVGLDEDDCAAACDANLPGCVGFQYIQQGEPATYHNKDEPRIKNQLCFLFSKFSTGFYYTGCGKNPNPAAVCYAKASKFEGTTLKPDPSGKCAQCFKKLTKANRCY